MPWKNEPSRKKTEKNVEDQKKQVSLIGRDTEIRAYLGLSDGNKLKTRSKLFLPLGGYTD